MKERERGDSVVVGRAGKEILAEILSDRETNTEKETCEVWERVWQGGIKAGKETDRGTGRNCRESGAWQAGGWKHGGIYV